MASERIYLELMNSNMLKVLIITLYLFTQNSPIIHHFCIVNNRIIISKYLVRRSHCGNNNSIIQHPVLNFHRFVWRVICIIDWLDVRWSILPPDVCCFSFRLPSKVTVKSLFLIFSPSSFSSLILQMSSSLFIITSLLSRA